VRPRFADNPEFAASTVRPMPLVRPPLSRVDQRAACAGVVIDLAAVVIRPDQRLAVLSRGWMVGPRTPAGWQRPGRVGVSAEQRSPLRLESRRAQAARRFAIADVMGELSLSA
jgi:hypothetical protein